MSHLWYLVFILSIMLFCIGVAIFFWGFCKIEQCSLGTLAYRNLPTAIYLFSKLGAFNRFVKNLAFALVT